MARTMFPNPSINSKWRLIVKFVTEFLTENGPIEKNLLIKKLCEQFKCSEGYCHIVLGRMLRQNQLFDNGTKNKKIVSLTHF